MEKLRVAITGAAGNLGSLLSSSLVDREVDLNLLVHRRNVSTGLLNRGNVTVFKVDLADKETLYGALSDVDVVVHFAGVLFKANPEKFLSTTNTQYFENLLEIAVEKKIKRVILISFPHVEGESSPQKPTNGLLDGNPTSMHAKTRLEEENLLFNFGKKYKFEAVSLRVGMVYGDGILMIDAAQWFAKHCLLGVWKSPTYIHLISKVDFVGATISAIMKPNIKGIYHIGDDGVQTLQEFLDAITIYKGNHKPWRMPVWMIMTAARMFEFISMMFRIQSPLTVDFVKIGMVSYYGNTNKMKEELLPKLKYRTYKDALETF